MSMHARNVLPWIALACFVPALIHVAIRQESADLAAPPIEPYVSPFEEAIVACGIVESETENVEVSSTVSGVVFDVLVCEGDQVEQGQVLFRLDDRHLQADLRARQAECELAKSELAALTNQPRHEEIVIAETRLRSAEARLLDAQDEADRTSKLAIKGAVSHREVVHVKQLLEAAQAVLDERRAELTLLKAGAWEHDVEVKRQCVACAMARCRQVETEIQRLQTTAPIAGEVLQVNVRPGEFVGVPPLIPPIVLGNTSNLHVRVDIDEYEIPRFRPQAAAIAVPRGSAPTGLPLTVVHVEPYVVPKKWVSGYQHQVVDTRVLQVIYRITTQCPTRVYVGQQMDVFIDAAESAREFETLASGKRLSSSTTAHRNSRD